MWHQKSKRVTCGRVCVSDAVFRTHISSAHNHMTTVFHWGECFHLQQLVSAFHKQQKSSCLSLSNFFQQSLITSLFSLGGFNTFIHTFEGSFFFPGQLRKAAKSEKRGESWEETGEFWKHYTLTQLLLPDLCQPSHYMIASCYKSVCAVPNLRHFSCVLI